MNNYAVILFKRNDIEKVEVCNSQDEAVLCFEKTRLEKENEGNIFTEISEHHVEVADEVEIVIIEAINRVEIADKGYAVIVQNQGYIESVFVASTKEKAINHFENTLSEEEENGIEFEKVGEYHVETDSCLEIMIVEAKKAVA